MPTAITRMLGIRYPLLGAPMFLVSNVEMTVALAEAGALGCIPSLNYRKPALFREAIREIRSRTSAPFGVNLTLAMSDRLIEDLTICFEEQVPLLVTSMGDPSEIVQAARPKGIRVFSDVIGMRHARKCVQAGVDALIAVTAGAGGHAGTLNPFVFLPYLKRETGLPVLAAGGIATGEAVAAALALGADAAYVGTRFVACEESPADSRYQAMIHRATPEDVLYTPEVSGHAASILRESLEAWRENGGKPWKEVWSAGQAAGLITDSPSCRTIVSELIADYEAARNRLPSLSPLEA